jgi:lipopolysaccharide biosynthesis regulator YciM
MSIDGLRNLIRNTPELIMRFEMKLRSDYQKAVESLKTDEAKGVKGLMDVASTGKVGYPEIKEAQSKLIEAADSSFRNCELAEAVGPDYGIDYLEDLVKVYKATAPGVRAEVRIARLERARENVQAAIARLQKVLKYDARLLRSELDDANRVLGEISQDGEAKIQAALAAGKSAGTKELLKKLAKDYAGTEAGKHAADEAK